MAKTIAKFTVEVNLLPAQKRKPKLRIKFIRPGEPKPVSSKGRPTLSGLLSRARDWLFDFDLPEHTSPSYMSSRTTRPLLTSARTAS